MGRRCPTAAPTPTRQQNNLQATRRRARRVPQVHVIVDTFYADRRPQPRRDGLEGNRAVIMIPPLVQHQRAIRPTTGEADGTRHARGVWRYHTALLRTEEVSALMIKRVTIRNITGAPKIKAGHGKRQQKFVA